MKTLRLLSIAFLSLSVQMVRSQDSAPVHAAADLEIVYPRFLEKSGIQILSATYGSGTAFSDVTDETIKLMNQQSRFYARPEWLRTDPTPGWSKVLAFVFSYQGHRHLFSCGEGGEVRIPLFQRIVAERLAVADP